MSANSIEIVGDEIPGKVRLTMRSADGEWTTTYLDLAEVAAIHAALGQFAPAPEVRGYVVLTHEPGGSGRFDVNWDGLLYDDQAAAEEEAAHARNNYGNGAHPEAHVGVVTALPAPTEETPA